MKRIVSICFALAFVLGGVGMAAATPMAYNHGIGNYGCQICPPGADKFHFWSDGADDYDVKLRRGDAHEFSFNLGLDGFDQGTDFAYAAWLEFGISARADRNYWGLYTVDFGLPRFERFETDGNGVAREIELLGIAPLFTLNQTGGLDVTLMNITDRFFSSNENYMVTSAYLNAVGCEASVQPVPEPGTILLLGSGLLGVAGIGRKKMRKN